MDHQSSHRDSLPVQIKSGKLATITSHVRVAEKWNRMEKTETETETVGKSKWKVLGWIPVKFYVGEEQMTQPVFVTNELVVS